MSSDSNGLAYGDVAPGAVQLSQSGSDVEASVDLYTTNAAHVAEATAFAGNDGFSAEVEAAYAVAVATAEQEAANDAAMATAQAVEQMAAVVARDVIAAAEAAAAGTVSDSQLTSLTSALDDMTSAANTVTVSASELSELAQTAFEEAEAVAAALGDSTLGESATQGKDAAGSAMEAAEATAAGDYTGAAEASQESTEAIATYYASAKEPAVSGTVAYEVAAASRRRRRLAGPGIGLRRRAASRRLSASDADDARTQYRAAAAQYLIDNLAAGQQAPGLGDHVVIDGGDGTMEHTILMACGVSADAVSRLVATDGFKAAVQAAVTAYTLLTIGVTTQAAEGDCHSDADIVDLGMLGWNRQQIIDTAEASTTATAQNTAAADLTVTQSVAPTSVQVSAAYPAPPPSPSPPPPPSPPTTTTAAPSPPPPDTTDPGTIDGGADNVETGDDGGSGDDSGMIAGIVVGVLVLLCLLPFVYAAATYGCDNVGVWYKLKMTHSKPNLPIFYIPKERREQMKRDLYSTGAAKPASSTTEGGSSSAGGSSRKPTEQGASIGLAVEKV